MDFREFFAGKNDEGRRLDRIVKKIFSEKKINANIQELVRKKLIRVNGVKSQSSSIIKQSDSIEIAAFLFNDFKNDSEDKKIRQIKKEDFPYKILFKNQHLMMIEKPAKVNVQPAFKGEKAISVSIKNSFKENDSLSFTPAPLHRLDKYTSGILTVSMSLEGARWFSKALENHQIVKTYLAVLDGKIEKEEKWTDSISKDRESKDFYKSKVFKDKKNEDLSAKECISIVKPLKTAIYKGKAVTFASIRILTGRKHQIRAQCAARGYPLTEDNIYGKGSGKFFLHAWKLNFPSDNPLKVKEEITCPLPDEYLAFLKLTLKIDNLTDII